MGDFAQIGIGGCFALGVLKLVFDFIERRERKQKETLNGDSPEHRYAEALETIAVQSQVQSRLLQEMRDDQREQSKLTSRNGDLLERMDDKLNALSN